MTLHELLLHVCYRGSCHNFVVVYQEKEKCVISSLKAKVRRTVVDRLPANPVADLNPPPIEVMIPVGQRDIRKLQVVLDGLFKNLDNPIAKLTIVTPSRREFLHKFPVNEFSVLEDREVLGSEIYSRALETAKNWYGRIPSGWFLQQLVKFAFSKNSIFPGVLVLDSETLLLKRRTFLDTFGVQLLIPSYEFHKPYESHYLTAFEGNRKLPHKAKFSFVAHHQLFQPSIVRAMFPHASSLTTWLNLGDPNSVSSPVSEYHTYGRFAMENYPHQVALGSFRNKAMSYSNVGFLDGSRLNKLNSVSFHEYAL